MSSTARTSHCSPRVTAPNAFDVHVLNRQEQLQRIDGEGHRENIGRWKGCHVRLVILPLPLQKTKADSPKRRGSLLREFRVGLKARQDLPASLMLRFNS